MSTTLLVTKLINHLAGFRGYLTTSGQLLLSYLLLSYSGKCCYVTSVCSSLVANGTLYSVL